MKLVSLNTGSSTVKYAVFDAPGLRRVARGRASRIGAVDACIEHERAGQAPQRRALALPDHRTALGAILADLSDSGLAGAAAVTGVGHRVVHGGDRFTVPARIDDDVLSAIRELGRLAPLHNPVDAAGIEAARALLPEATHVAVFDTAFHARLPERARRYAIPGALAERGYRRYGFHGISHGYVARTAAAALDRPLESLRLITLHLGNGASAAAIRDGRSVDTSMGMTPLEGLVMGTRCGDLDPAVALRLVGEEGMSVEAAERLLNHESGLRALAGTSDMREIERRAAAGDADAGTALDVFCYRVRKCIGAYWAALGGVDGLVFTGGIGENAAEVRARCCNGLDGLGIALEPGRNARHEPAVHAGSVPVLVVPTDEEHEIARATLGALRGEADVK